MEPWNRALIIVPFEMPDQSDYGRESPMDARFIVDKLAVADQFLIVRID